MVASPTSVDEELLELGQRLIREHDEVPAGAVLRCLARSVRVARTWACPPEHLLSTVEASTRWRLAERTTSADAMPEPLPRPGDGTSADRRAGA
jgi:hypothetical protein